MERQAWGGAQEGPIRTSPHGGQLAGQRVEGHLSDGRFENK